MKNIEYKQYLNSRRKIVDIAQALDCIIKARTMKRKIVFTNGCFDILHAGHVWLLEQARSLGDFLVLGLNSDRSVRLQGKGKDRPLVPQQERALIIAALEAVTLVVIYDDPTPLSLIKAFMPDVLIKGSDWPVQDIIGAKTVLAHGGKVKSLPIIKGISTTALVSKIRAEYRTSN